ncbi:hypothetical protein [Streptomyces celluloflavus]|uniref:hypothetical protein n=1 Tax=Streptomyces celluloflavus TaxID=58344 RepID=UPI00345FFCD0|nr:hypothetical protein OG717_29730 [Streptomyces celluloflavus]
MIDTTPYPVRLARDIARLIDTLDEHLIQAPAQDAVHIFGVLDGEDGLLGRLTALLATGSYVAVNHAQHGTLPPEMGLALGRASNELHDLHLDLEEHVDPLRKPQAPATTATTMPPTPPAPGTEAGRRR